MAVHFYEHHLGDWAKDVRGLSMAEEGAYRRLLDAYYSTEQPLPPSLDDCCDIAGARDVRDRAAVSKVLAKYFQSREDGYHQKRADAEIARYQDKQRKAAASSKLGVEARRRNRTVDPPINRTVDPPVDRTVHRPDNRTDNRTDNHTQSPVPSTQLNTYDASHRQSSAAKNPADDAGGDDENIDTSTGTEDVPDELPDCPHAELIALYAKHLPELVQPRVWENGRREALRARWRQCSKPSTYSPGYRTKTEGLEFWEKYFAHVATNTRLAKGFPRREGSGIWQPDLAWLVKADNFAKVIEGAYS